MNNKEIGHVDAALGKLRPFGKYTIVQFSIQIIAQFAVATHMLSIVFTGQENPFRCPVSHSSNGTKPSNGNTGNSSLGNTTELEYDSICHDRSLEPSTPGLNFTECTDYNVEYQLPKDLYFVSEFDLVCDREFLTGLTQTLLTLGHAIGSLLFPYFADNYGRKPILLLGSFLWLGSSIALAFSVNYIMLAVFKVLVGIFLQGVAQTSLTLMIEVLTSEQRGHLYGSLAFIFWTISIMMMVPIAYLLRFHSWRYLELAYCGYFVFILLYVLLMDESIRWLAANGLKDRVVEILKRASRWNKANLEEVVDAFDKGNEADIMKNEKTSIFQISDIKLQDDTLVEKPKETTLTVKEENTPVKEEIIKANEALKEQGGIDENLNCTSVFRNKILRNNTFFSMFAWFFNSLTYYALLLMSHSLSGSLYLNYFLNCVVEIPSAIFIYFYIDKLGRKVCFAGFSIIAGTALVTVAMVSTFFPDQSVAIKVLSILGKFGISGSFGTIYAFTPELFPTNVRTTGLGLANMTSCLGGMLAPYMELLMDKASYAPGLIFGISSLALSVWVYFLPETARRQLPQSIMDIELWIEEKKHEKRRRKTNITEKDPHVNLAFTD